jgi:hypothetical protein
MLFEYLKHVIIRALIEATENASAQTFLADALRGCGLLMFGSFRIFSSRGYVPKEKREKD